MAKMRDSAVIGTDKAVEPRLIPIFVMGRRYEVPETLTIMKALEHAGFKFIRGCGCRGGICGACATVYRKPGDYKIRVGLACQTVVEPNMHLTQMPFYPANRASYDYSVLKPVAEEVFKLYPELFRCVACNACTKACPMDVQAMDCMQAVIRGDIATAAESSFSCIQCGLCASRCFGEAPQYHVFQLVRRLYAGKMVPKAQHVADMMAQVKSGKFEPALREVMGLDTQSLKKRYTERETEPEMAPEDWQPNDKDYL
ncbi:MAG: 4Fe-4S dicluster domain-containing protein [Chloroflexota bacterium]